MDERCKHLVACGDQMFSQRQPLLSLWQHVSEQFYPERADFLVTRSLGEEFAVGLSDSYPLLIRRELGDFLSTLRRKDQPWFDVSIERDDSLDHSGRQWLERAAKVMRNAMYDMRAQFTKAMKEADHDYVSFGNAVLSIELNPQTNRLLYQCWHPRDVVWRYTLDGRIAEVHRRWKPFAKQVVQLFKMVHPNVQEQAQKNPFTEIECRHVVVKADEYDCSEELKQKLAIVSRRKRIEPGDLYVELYLDVLNHTVMHEAVIGNEKYVIPRWKTISGSQYGHSPAVTVGLPDARLIQAMSLTLLEAGEMAVRPPMAAKVDMLPEGAKLFSGGITPIDAEFDARLEDIIAPITNDSRALPFGLDLLKDKQAMLAQAFYIQKINLPQFDHEMTAYEFSQRLQEYIRNVTPLFEPLDSEYHAKVCDLTFRIAMDAGGFGPADEIPESVRGSETTYKFDSPISEAEERQNGQKFLEAQQLVQAAMAVDPSTVAMVDWRVALRDALSGKRIAQKWLRSEEQVEQFAADMEAKQMAQQQIEQAAQGAEAVEAMGRAGQAMAEA